MSIPFRSMPAVRGLPLVGSLLDFRRDFLSLQLTAAREAGPLARLRFGPRNVVFLADPEPIREMLVEKAACFPKAPDMAVLAKPLLGDGLLTLDGADHRRHRRVIAPVFAKKHIERLAGIMSERAARLADQVGDGERVDVYRVMSRHALDVVAHTLFSTDMKDVASEIHDAIDVGTEYLLSLMGSLAPMIAMQIPTPRRARVRRAKRRLDAMLESMIAERRHTAKPPEDLLSLLVAARDAEEGAGLSDAEVRDEALTLLVSGHETTAAALSWTFFLLSRHREVAEELADSLRQADDPAQVPLLGQILDESLRLYPAVHALARLAERDTELGGFRIPAGTIVVASIYALHRDPIAFPDPERFVPSRFVTPMRRGFYLPFGVGPRSCIGAHFALLEARVMLAVLSKHVRFDVDSSWTPELHPLFSLRPRHGIPGTVRRVNAPTATS